MAIDQEINDRGVLLDMDLVESAIKMNEISSEEIKQKMISLTNLENPNSVSQLKAWLNDNVVTEFSPEMFSSLIDRIVVKARDDIKVFFKDGRFVKSGI